MIAVTARTSGRGDAQTRARERTSQQPPTAVVWTVMKPLVSRFRAVRASIVVTAAQVPRRKLLAIGAAIVILVAFALLVPMSSAVHVPHWASAVGPWFPLGFFVAHVLVTIFPLPRTAFTLSAR